MEARLPGELRGGIWGGRGLEVVPAGRDQAAGFAVPLDHLLEGDGRRHRVQPSPVAAVLLGLFEHLADDPGILVLIHGDALEQLIVVVVRHPVEDGLGGQVFDELLLFEEVESGGVGPPRLPDVLAAEDGLEVVVGRDLRHVDLNAASGPDADDQLPLVPVVGLLQQLEVEGLEVGLVDRRKQWQCLLDGRRGERLGGRGRLLGAAIGREEGGDEEEGEALVHGLHGLFLLAVTSDLYSLFLNHKNHWSNFQIPCKDHDTKTLSIFVYAIIHNTN